MQVLSEEACLAMQSEGICAFRDETFQAQLRESWAAAGDDHKMRKREKEALCLKVQIPIVAKFGFEASQKGVFLSFRAITDQMRQQNPQINKNSAWLSWLTDVSQQLANPLGPAFQEFEEQLKKAPHLNEQKGQIVDETRVNNDLEKACQRAAQAIKNADVLVLHTGAGFSADSGLAVYKDIAQIEAYQSRGLKYHDICDPAWLSEPDLFYGFWGTCFNDYRFTRPHRGYEIVAKWKRERFHASDVAASIRSRLANQSQDARKFAEPYMCSDHAGAFFVFTSNVDAHSFDHFDANEVRECHGNVELWQCSEPCHDMIWRAPLEYSFVVDKQSMCAEAGGDAQIRRDNKQTADESTVPRVGQVHYAERENLLCGWPPMETSTEIIESFQWSNRPICPRCGSAARPAILMFGDWFWRDNEAQAERYSMWLKAVKCEATARKTETPLRVCVLEVGAGKNVPTVREESQGTCRHLSQCGAECTLIRVNQDFPDADRPKGRGPDYEMISLQGGGRECLEHMERAYAKLQSGSAEVNDDIHIHSGVQQA